MLAGMIRPQCAAAFVLAMAGSLAATQSVNATPPDGLHWPPSRAARVTNTKLALHFDFRRREIFGRETVTLRPIQPGLRRFYLDSSGLTITSVRLLRGGGAAIPLPFARRDPRLWITLDRAYQPRDTIRIRIVYQGVPAAGLFFVHPSRLYPHRPREVYSQGEPELNHFWFPCWDYPNDMATSETVVTVPAGLSVVSNGKLIRVTHAGATTTYDWRESVPHSSYLTSIAAGPWRKVRDRYENKPVDYYVPRGVSAARARRSFHLTPDMIAFFSRATGVDYPYEQYAQVAVHDFLFGGQENVSATTLTDTTLHSARADRDYSSTGLVDHELGQHWFGDYVQGRDWADIWLNEGFATYMEALYTQHHRGYDAYRHAVYQDQLADQAEQRGGDLRPLVDRRYADPLDLFDAVTHEKGAAVLDMLRFVVDGPAAARRPAGQHEPLFRGLHAYLTKYRGRAVDTHQLIQALRATTGRELGWFFREWVYQKGHPDYRVAARYSAGTKSEAVTVAQAQRGRGVPRVFTMPMELAFHGAGGAFRDVIVRNDARRQTFTIQLAFRPLWVDFDPDDFLDKSLVFPQPAAALIAAAEHDPEMMSRLWATQQLGTQAGAASRAEPALERVLASDGFYAVRAAAAGSLAELGGRRAQTALLAALSLARQPDDRVRAAVVDALAPFARQSRIYAALVRALGHDRSYAVEAAAARAIGKSGNPGAFAVLREDVAPPPAAAVPEIHVLQAELAAMAATHDTRAIPILLAWARAGEPERARAAALGALAAVPADPLRARMPALTATVREAIADPDLATRQAGEQLAAEFRLTQFIPEIQADAAAPFVMQSSFARPILAQLQHAGR
jgi:aminopeptidase N